MNILDQIRKSREEKKEHTTPPPRGHILKEILQDKSKSILFFELLRKNEEDDLANRIVKNEFIEGDIELLEKQRRIFSEKMTEAEKIEKLLTKENIIEIARNSDFEMVVNQDTPEGAIKIITSQLKKLSITDEDRFNTIASLMQTKESYRNGEYKKNQ